MFYFGGMLFNYDSPTSASLKHLVNFYIFVSSHWTTWSWFVLWKQMQPAALCCSHIPQSPIVSSSFRTPAFQSQRSGLDIMILLLSHSTGALLDLMEAFPHGIWSADVSWTCGCQSGSLMFGIIPPPADTRKAHHEGALFVSRDQFMLQ